jgi:hypothetical protein
VGGALKWHAPVPSKKDRNRVEKKLLIVRLLVSVDERLRPLALFHGDLSVLVEEAIAVTDLAKVELIKLGGRPANDLPPPEKVVGATSFLISEQTLKVIERAAIKRNKSKNVIVNSALLWWLDHASHSMRRR